MSDREWEGGPLVSAVTTLGSWRRWADQGDQEELNSSVEYFASWNWAESVKISPGVWTEADTMKGPRYWIPLASAPLAPSLQSRVFPKQIYSLAKMW